MTDQARGIRLQTVQAPAVTVIPVQARETVPLQNPNLQNQSLRYLSKRQKVARKWNAVTKSDRRVAVLVWRNRKRKLLLLIKNLV